MLNIAAVLGSVIALRISYGTIVQHMSKELQHRLGGIVQQFGWDCQLTLEMEAQAELAWLHSNWHVSTAKGSETREKKRQCTRPQK